MERSCEKRQPPFVLDNEVESLDEVSLGLRAHKLPKFLGEETDQFSLNFGHELALMDGVEHIPFSDDFSPGHVAPDNPSFDVFDNDISSLNPDSTTKLMQNEQNDSVCCFGMVGPLHTGALEMSKGY